MAILRGQQVSTQLSGSYIISGSTQELIADSITLTGNVTASGTIKADAFESVAGGTTIDFNDDINIEGSVSASSTSTGSFGELIVDSNGTFGGDLTVGGNITAQNYIVSSSVTSIEYQSLSGSTIFGDSADDTHVFGGNTISGSATSTGSFGELKISGAGQEKISLLGGTNQFINFGDADDYNIGAIKYIHSSTNQMQFITNNTMGFFITKNQDIGMKATGKFYFDGGYNTFFEESSADNVKFTIGGVEILDITETGVSGSATSTGSFGAIQSAGNITPKVDDTSNLGSAALRFSNVFTTDLQLSNEGKPEGNEVDGTTGSWTIQEGEDDLYLLNRKNGKKYKFKLEEIG